MAYGHPAFMLVAIGMAALTLRAGLRIRRRRLAGARPRRELRHVHLKLAKPTLVMIVVGFVGGPISVWWLREWQPFGTLHAYLGVLAVGLFVAAGWQGRRLEAGRRDALRAHALLGLVAVLAAALAVVAGLVLLP